MCGHTIHCSIEYNKNRQARDKFLPFSLISSLLWNKIQERQTKDKPKLQSENKACHLKGEQIANKQSKPGTEQTDTIVKTCELKAQEFSPQWI